MKFQTRFKKLSSIVKVTQSLNVKGTQCCIQFISNKKATLYKISLTNHKKKRYYQPCSFHNMYNTVFIFSPSLFKTTYLASKCCVSKIRSSKGFLYLTLSFFQGHRNSELGGGGGGDKGAIPSP